MKLVTHISDPHFGTQDPHIAEALLTEIKTLAPAVVAISGDLTQRARNDQFREARAWIDRLESPVIVVPGNHDIPLYDVFTRFLRPRVRYRRYITDNMFPFYADQCLTVCGVDTTKSLTTKHGQITLEQAHHIADLVRPHSERHWRLLVAHHPFVVPPNSDEPTVEGVGEALPVLEQARIDVILTGHLHIPHSEGAAGRNDKHTVINVHAGTCMSTRVRGEPNGYNQLRFENERVSIIHREWNGTQFVDGESKIYERQPGAYERIIKIGESPPNPNAFADGR